MIFNHAYYQLREQQLSRMLDIIHNQKRCFNLFYGDSLIEFMNNYDLNINGANCGIAGATTSELLAFVDEGVVLYQPRKVFLLIGTNDLGETVLRSPREIALNIKKLREIILENIKDCEVYCISLLPCIEEKQSYKVLNYGIRSNEIIRIVNKEIQKYVPAQYYINAYKEFLDKQGNTNIDLYEDGLHINGEGYNRLKSLLIKYTYLSEQE